MVKVKANTTLFIILQYINMTNQGVVHLKLTVLHVNDISIFKKGRVRHVKKCTGFLIFHIKVI